ncbi:MAG: hypothetical protein KKA84_08440 [Bacteroidetes bacterium]|nr:hypothetical protein [Bacteroidota bacterium]
MRFFSDPIKIMLPDNLIAKAKEFALAVVETVNYADSNQFQKSKIQQDHFISKLGEEAVAAVYARLHCIVKGPDYTIYLGDYKSWEDDLYISNVPVAVKTQTTTNAEKYGLSWTFQSSGKRRDPILDDPSAWVCLVKCNDKNNFECTVYPMERIGDLTFREPKLDHLKGRKKVVYFEDLNINLIK